MPETLRLQKRLWKLGVFVLVLAAFTVTQSVYSYNQDQKQRECFERKFAQNAATSKVRSKLVERESEIVSGVLNAFGESAGYLKDDPNAEIPKEEQARLRKEMIDSLLTYTRVSKEIKADREETPLPAYPEGACDQ